MAQEKTRHDEEARNKVSAYDLPLVPVDAAPAGGSATASGQGKP